MFASLSTALTVVARATSAPVRTAPKRAIPQSPPTLETRRCEQHPRERHRNFEVLRGCRKGGEERVERCVLPRRAGLVVRGNQQPDESIKIVTRVKGVERRVQLFFDRRHCSAASHIDQMKPRRKHINGFAFADQHRLCRNLAGDPIGKRDFDQYVADVARSRMRPPIAGDRLARNDVDETRYRTLCRYQYDPIGRNECEGARRGRGYVFGSEYIRGRHMAAVYPSAACNVARYFLLSSKSL